jgi:hypothetical protein
MTRSRTQHEVADLEFRMERELAERVACPRCTARVGETCWNAGLGSDLRAPAHWQRIKEAKEASS